jgi:hypothetical protein
MCEVCSNDEDGVYMTVVMTCEAHFFPPENNEDDGRREPKRKCEADHEPAAKRRKLADQAEAKDEADELPSYEQSQAQALWSPYYEPRVSAPPVCELRVSAPPVYKKPCACRYQAPGMTSMGWQVQVVRPIGKMVVSYPYPGWQKDIQGWKDLAEIVIKDASQPRPRPPLDASQLDAFLSYWRWLDTMANIAKELLAALDSHCKQECAGLGFILALVTFLHLGPNEKRAEGGPVAIAGRFEAGPEVLPRAMHLQFEPLWPPHTTDFCGSAFEDVRG